MSKHKEEIPLRKRSARQLPKQIELELLTPDEWIERYGKALGINSPEYVRQMCRGNFIGQSYTVAHLPKGWQAKKIGRSWVIFRSKA